MEKLIKITQGNINNGHIYLSKVLDFFPKESIGGPNKQTAGQSLSLDVQGVGTIVTDIAGDKKIFRDRTFPKSFFKNCNIKNGDFVCIKKISSFKYNLTPSLAIKNQEQIQSTHNNEPKLNKTNNKTMPKSGLVIAEPWIGKILSGGKSWEMRSKHTSKLETIALIKKGSGTIVGTARIVESRGPYTRKEMIEHGSKHQIPVAMIEDGSVDKWNHAWVLDDITPFEKPLPYNHPSGAVTWVNL